MLAGAPVSFSRRTEDEWMKGRDGGMMLAKEGEEQLHKLKRTIKKESITPEMSNEETSLFHICTEILRNSIFPKVAPSLTRSRLLVFHLQ